MTIKSTVLLFNDLATGGSSDKEYRCQVVKNSDTYSVAFQYGRRSGTLQSGTKVSGVSLEEAECVYDRLVREKLSKGYVGMEAGGIAPAAPLPVPSSAGRTPYPQEQLEEIGAERAELLVKDDRYLMQIKKNGHFRQVQKTAKEQYVGYNKLGEAVPVSVELAKALNAITLKTFFIEGELVGDDYYAFNLLNANGADLRTTTYNERWLTLDDKAPEFTIDTWHTTSQKQAALALCYKNRAEGVCFKRKDALYRTIGQHFKFKFLKSITCRVLELGTKGKENARLGLLKDSKWIEVAGASMIGKDKRIQIGSLVEVTFLYFTGSRLCQPRIVELRDDVKESECTFNRQIKKSMYQEGVEAA